MNKYYIVSYKYDNDVSYNDVSYNDISYNDIINYCDFKIHGLYDSNEIKDRFFYLEKYYFNKKILIFDCNKNNININIFN